MTKCVALVSCASAVAAVVRNTSYLGNREASEQPLKEGPFAKARQAPPQLTFGSARRANVQNMLLSQGCQQKQPDLYDKEAYVYTPSQLENELHVLR